MQKYKYTAVNLQKEKFTGIFIANDERDLAAQLAKQNLFLVSASPYSDKTPSAFFTLGTGKVSLKELTAFCRQISIMLGSGMALLDCLETLKSQKYSSYFRSILSVVFEDVKGGMMLSEALQKHKKVFPDFFRSMIYVGEVSGKLETVFSSLADYYESDSKIRRKTASALAYPLMLMVLAVGIVVLMLTYIVPTFQNSLAALEITPTGITKVVYDISDWTVANWLYVLAAIVVIVILLILFGRTKKGRYLYDVIKIKMPLIGRLQQDLITARFARGFGLLLSSGMDIVDAMESIVIVLGNLDVERRFKLAIEDVRHGFSLAESLEKYKLFPDILLQMISVGEKTASIDEVLSRSCGYFDEQVETTLNAVTGTIQPVMLIIMGLIVGTLFLAIYSPILNIMTGLGG